MTTRRPTVPRKGISPEALAASTFDGLTLTDDERRNVDRALASRDFAGLSQRELRACARAVRWS